jgi:enoyl-CoA hydratase/carnithine racemase
MTTIRFERDGAVGSIVLANPPFNRLDLRFSEALRIAVHQASESDIRVLVVRSEGPHFSFGGEVREWPGKDVNWFRTFVADVNVSYRAIEMLKVPTVAVVQGVAFGGGLELALACDFLVAADNAVFRCVEGHHGDVADRRRVAADCRARRSRPGIPFRHAGRTDFRKRSR